MNGLYVNNQPQNQGGGNIMEELLKLLRDAGYSGGLSEFLNDFLKNGGKGRNRLIDPATGLAGSGLNFGGGGGEAGGGLSFTDLGGGV